MAQLTDLASQGKGNIAVILPDTTTSARYTEFDAPYLKQAFEDFLAQNGGRTRALVTALNR